MNERSTLVADATDRIFKELGDPAIVGKDARHRSALWGALEESGLTLAWVDGAFGGAGASIADGFDVLRIAGAFAVNVPIAETLLAGWLLGQAKIAAPKGVLTLAPIDIRDRVELGFRNELSGRARAIPFAREASHLVVAVPRAQKIVVALVSAPQSQIAERQNLAGDARDIVTFDKSSVLAVGETGLSRDQLLLMGATVRATLMAGAMQAILNLSVAYANERVAFEKPIGKFQVIQHNLAKLAAEAAAALAAAGSAADAIASASELDATVFFEAASAKIRVGEAAATGSAIAHQVYGALGFSQEHVLHRYTQRLLAWRDDFGAESYWALKLGQLVAGNGADALWPIIAAR